MYLRAEKTKGWGWNIAIHCKVGSIRIYLHEAIEHVSKSRKNKGLGLEHSNTL